MSNYTNIAKPTGTNYTKVNDQLALFDSTTITYNSATVNFDGFGAVYTNLAKPISSSYTKINKPT